MTEWQIAGAPGSQNLTDEQTAQILVKGAAYAFAHKVDKIFMVEFDYLPEYAKSKLAYGTLINKLKYFKNAIVNTEIMGENDKISVGVYEFKVPNGSTVLVAWGGGQLTAGGTIVQAVDIFGNSVSHTNNVFNLSETPYIIEVQQN